MNVRIEVRSTEIKEKNGVSKRTQKPYNIREQEAYLHRADKPYPVAMKIALGDQAHAYQPGFYTLAPESFFVGRFGDLECRPVMVPEGARPAKAA